MNLLSFFKKILTASLLLASTLSAAPNMWVANSGNSTVSIIDTATNTIVATILQADGMFANPEFLIFTPDGNYCYVNNLDDNSLSVIRASDLSFVTKILDVQGNFDAPYLSSITPNGMLLYVSNYANGESDVGTVSVISVPVNTLDTSILQTTGQFSAPYPITISPNGASVYVGNYANTTISVIDVSSNTLNLLINDPTFVDISWIAFTPDGRYAYTANYNDGPFGSVSVIDTSTFTVTNISAAAGAFSKPIYISMSLDGTRAYVLNSSSNSVSVIDTASLTLIANVTDASFDYPAASALTPDGAYLYIINYYNNSVSIMRTSDNTIVGNIAGLSNPLAIQVAPPIILPVANPVLGTTPVNTFLVGSSVLSNDTGVDLTIIGYTEGTQGGSVVMNPDGRYVYTPPVNFSGTDTFSYTLQDGYGNQATSTVTITVTPLAPPTAFIGTIKKINRNTYRLTTRWKASTSPTVVAYQIYQAGQLVKVIPANAFLRFETSITSPEMAANFQIAAVDALGATSALISLRVCP